MSEPREKEPLIYVNGEFYPKSEAKISVYDHGLLYGDGVFEGIRVYDGVIFKLKEHIDRLFESAKSIKIDLGMSKEDMERLVIEAVKRNGYRDAHIRVIVTRGYGKMGVDPRNCEKPSIIIITEPRKPSLKREGIEAIIASIRRVPNWAVDPKIKSLNYLNNVLARMEAIEAGVDEAIMLNQHGYVSEASSENIFMVKDEKVITPPLEAGILRGITRQTVIDIARELGYEVEEKNITPHDLYNADEVFLTGTAAEIVPVLKIDGREIGGGKPGPITERIRRRYMEIRSDPRYGVKVHG